MRINIVEDEANLNKIITTYLEREGYSVTSFCNGLDALKCVNTKVDLWIIDIMLPDTNGFEIFNKIKEVYPDALTIFISARNKEMDRVMGLEMGCDDYISKPFMTRELIIRVNKLLKVKVKKSSAIKFGDYEINTNRHKVYYKGKSIEFSLKEYELLLYLLENEKIAISREQIIDRIWDGNYEGSLRVVDDTIRRIRKKIPVLKIETVYGFGYTFEGF